MRRGNIDNLTILSDSYLTPKKFLLSISICNTNNCDLSIAYEKREAKRKNKTFVAQLPPYSTIEKTKRIISSSTKNITFNHLPTILLFERNTFN